MLGPIFPGGSAGSQFVLSLAGEPGTLGGAGLLGRIEQAAGRLAACGVGAGDRVLHCGEQGAPAFIAFWACVRIGAAFVPVDPSWADTLRRLALRKIAPRVIVTGDESERARWYALDPALQSLQFDVDALAAAPSASETPLPREFDSGIPAACLFTSGTTAEPKVVVLSRGALVRSAVLAVRTFEWSAGERLLNLPDPQTMSGLRNAFLAAPLAGMHWVCAPRSRRADIFSLLELLRQARAQRIVAAPLLLRQINLLGERVPADLLAPTRALYCTGTDLSAREVTAFFERFHVPVINYYGLTESVGLCLSQRLAGWSSTDTSLGWPAGCEIRIVDAEGLPVPAGTPGELRIRQEWPMSGYLEDSEATAQCFSGGWLRTGDIVRQHADGRVTLVGRRSNFIKTPGTERVHPLEIEAVLEQHANIAEAAVCGLPQPAGGESIAAILVPRAGWQPTGAELKAIANFVTERLGRERAPAVFRCVKHIPRNTSGKILRHTLRELFNA
ncbi:MAG TPA: class I adenylate-forming enzyme family protein [Steroidobacteraceae bacterium]|nr:class I adenylate-forming enzyme family protein [Steroidobacteraceae bacterium]